MTFWFVYNGFYAYAHICNVNLKSIETACLIIQELINVFFDQGFSKNIHEPAKNRNEKHD